EGIADADQTLDELQALGTLRIQADRELAVVQRVEVRRGVELPLARVFVVGHRLVANRVELRVRVDLLRARELGGPRLVAGDARRRVETMIVEAAGTLDVDHLRAVVRRRRGAHGPTVFQVKSRTRMPESTPGRTGDFAF